MQSDSPSRVDPTGLREYSVVFTDRALNHMSQRFQQVMRELADPNWGQSALSRKVDSAPRFLQPVFFAARP